MTNHIPRARLTADGWYVQGAWTLRPNRVLVVSRYDTFTPNRDVVSTQTKTWTLGLNYYFKGQDIKLMTDYLRVSMPHMPGWHDKALVRLQTGF